MCLTCPEELDRLETRYAVLKEDKEKIFICGGASIYKLALQFADTLELTKILFNAIRLSPPVTA